MGNTITLREPLTVRERDFVRTLAAGEVIELTGQRDGEWVKVLWKRSPEDTPSVWARKSDLAEYV